MSLATRCSVCSTVFRVVPDQLRVSDGWVRCGRCDAVFDATDSLFDLDTGQPATVDGISTAASAGGDAAAPAAASTAAPAAAPAPASPASAKPDASGGSAVGGFGPSLKPRGPSGGDAGPPAVSGPVEPGGGPAGSPAPTPSAGAPAAHAQAAGAPAASEPDVAPLALLRAPALGAHAPAGPGRAVPTPPSPPPPPSKPVPAPSTTVDAASPAPSADSGAQASSPAAAPGAELPHDRATHAGRSPDDAEPLAIEPAEPVDSDRMPARPPRLVPSLADPPGGPEGPPESGGPVWSASELASDHHERPRRPAFVRDAERAAFWRRPAVRAGLLAGLLVLAGLLALQSALLWRDTLAAHVPALAPALHDLCEQAGCRITPLRRIDQLVVDSSGLNRVDGQDSLYMLQVQLRNRADTPVMMPALDLTLTDNSGRLVVRRVLKAADLGIGQEVLQSGQELPIKVVLASSAGLIDGYTLELFYP